MKTHILEKKNNIGFTGTFVQVRLPVVNDLWQSSVILISQLN
jgi:hypothetical protein